jgi:hypothetical protein
MSGKLGCMACHAHPRGFCDMHAALDFTPEQSDEPLVIETDMRYVPVGRVVSTNDDGSYYSVEFNVKAGVKPGERLYVLR